VFQKAVPTQDVTKPVSLPSFMVCRIFISHTVGSTDQPHPCPAPHFKNLQVFFICFLKCRNFSAIQFYAPNVALLTSSLIYVQFAGEKLFLLIVPFTTAIQHLISRVHLASFVLLLHK